MGRLGRWWMGGRKCVRPRSNASAVGYIRVSTEEQTLGPEAQRVALARWAEARKIQLVAVHEDRGVSGAAPLDRRPGLLAALASLESHSAAFLVAAKRDRLARDVIIAAQLERLVERQGARVVSADGTGEGDSPEAVLMRRLVDAIASYAERGIMRSTPSRTDQMCSTPPRTSHDAPHNSTPWRRARQGQSQGGWHSGSTQGGQGGDERVGGRVMGDFKWSSSMLPPLG